jgi:hypothetical protein
MKFMFFLVGFTVFFSPTWTRGNEVAERESAPPPNFGTVCELMLAEREKLKSYQVDFVCLKRRSYSEHDTSTVLFKGMVSVDKANGISVVTHSRLDAQHDGPGLEFERSVERSRERFDVVIVDTPSLQAVGSLTSDVLAFTSNQRIENRSSFIPFDLRMGAFGFVGDFTGGVTLEEITDNLGSKYADRPGKWVAPGVAEYLLPGHLVQIDIDRGFWPTAYRKRTRFPS